MTLVPNVPDHQQPWVVCLEIAERDLCAPTALVAAGRAAQRRRDLRGAQRHGVLTGVAYDTARLEGFRLRRPSIAQVTKWADVVGPQPSFDWFLNVNNNGAQDVPNSAGASIDSIVKGAQAFYDRTTLADKVGAAYHRVGLAPPSGPTPVLSHAGPYGSSPDTLGYAGWNGFKTNQDWSLYVTIQMPSSFGTQVYYYKNFGEAGGTYSHNELLVSSNGKLKVQWGFGVRSCPFTWTARKPQYSQARSLTLPWCTTRPTTSRLRRRLGRR